MSKNHVIAKKNSERGLERHKLFKDAISRAQLAIQEGFYVEAISIIESLLATRIESYLSYLEGRPVRFVTIGKRLQDRLQKTHGFDSKILDLFQNAILPWAEERHVAIHELAKLADDKSPTFSERYARLKQTAFHGEQLRKKLFSLVAKIRNENAKKSRSQLSKE